MAASSEHHDVTNTEDNNGNNDGKFYVPRRIKSLFRDMIDLARKLRTEFNETDMHDLQLMINEAQPIDEQERSMLKTIQMLYRYSSNEFITFLINGKLYPLVLWTESKRIVKQLRLERIVYLQYADGTYSCNRFVRRQRSPRTEKVTDADLASVKRASPMQSPKKHKPRVRVPRVAKKPTPEE